MLHSYIVTLYSIPTVNFQGTVGIRQNEQKFNTSAIKQIIKAIIILISLST